MQFPGAYKGVKKIFLAEILMVFVALCAIASAIIAAAVPNPNEVVVGALAAVLGVSGIIALVALIFQLIGLGQAGKDSGYMRFAFWVIILSIILTITTTILGVFIKDNPVVTSVSNVLDTVSKVISAVVLVFVIFGISVLADQLNDERMVNKGRLLINLIIILFIITIGLNIVASFIRNPADWWTTFVAVFAIIAAVLELVIYILYLLYLASATKMLKK